MKVLVIGATGGSGRAAVHELVRRGHAVTAMARNVSSLAEVQGIGVVQGDALVPEDLDAAVRGHDAVIVTLGIHENPLRVRLGLGRTPIDVRSRGTSNVIAAMRAHGVQRLVVQSSYGVGPSRRLLPVKWRIIFSVLLGPQIADTERQEEVVRGSGLAWTLVQPVGLVDADDGRAAFVSTSSETHGMQVSRAQVARVLVDAIEPSTHAAVPGATLAVSC